MKIKDLRNFSEFFNEKLRQSSYTKRNVHFIGTVNKDEKQNVDAAFIKTKPILYTSL